MNLKSGIRTLRRSRVVSALAIVAFALGFGVTHADWIIFDGVLLSPLPYAEPDRIVSASDTQPACATCPASYPKYQDWRARNQVFSAIGGSTEWSFVMTGSGDPVRVRGAKSTASLVDVFGIRPRVGRWFTEDEDRPGGPKVV